jgi:SAM-dependent methyltransferase
MMFPEKNLYTLYKRYIHEQDYSHRIPDITKKRTLEMMNTAVNCAEKWDTALDIGGGSGHYSIPLIHKFRTATLVELEKHEEQDYLLKRYSNFQFFQGKIEDVSVEGIFDFILLADVFEHIPDIQALAQKLASLQDTGGVVYILMPNPLLVGPAREAEIYYERTPYGHQRHYFPDETERIMKEAGYRLVHLSYEEGAFRQKMKRIIRGFSRRDKKFSRIKFYDKVIGPVLAVLYSPLLLWAESATYKDEWRNRENCEATRNIGYIFKKQ